MSAFSGEDRFSAPEEKSKSNLRGVMNADCPKCGLGFFDDVCDGFWENRKGWELGARRAGISFFWGESKIL